MKIAVVNDTVYPFFKGGAQKRVYEISRRLVQRGHNVHWYGMDYGVTEIESIKLHAVCPAYRLYTKEGRRMVSQALRFAIRLNIREHVDIIDCMNFPYLHCLRAKEASWRQHIPLVITWFEFWGDYWYKYLGKLGIVGKVVERMITSLPDMIIADSEKVKGQLVRAKVRDSRIRVVPDGVDTRLIASVEPSKEKFDVVYVGRILTHKKVDMLVRAVAGMEDVTLVVIGAGRNKEECEKLTEALGATKRIRFLGHVQEDRDVYAIMKSAKVLVLPSMQEGHPLVIPEANACGVPVIGIKGVCDEFINFGQTGYLSIPDDFSLRALITRALDLYPGFRKPCIEESKKYDWEAITDKVEAVYKELV